MCGICGFLNFKRNIAGEPYTSYGREMVKTLRHRGPDGAGVCDFPHAVVGHSRLAVIDVQKGGQPMTRYRNGEGYTIVYNGELYNAKEIRRALVREGVEFTTTSDTEVLLYAYMVFGTACVHLLNGIYAFGVWEHNKNRLFLCRDRFGVKPLFYTKQGDFFLFGSELKALFAFPGVERKIDRAGLCEIFGISPAVTPGNGVFCNMHELLPGYFATVDADGMQQKCYFSLHSAVHTDSYDETVDTVRYLFRDAVRRQTVSDVPLCTFLSGGLDSSLITAVAAEHMGMQLSTYSFDYEGNDRYFTPSDFQPDADTEYIQIMSEAYDTNHTVLMQNSADLVQNLYKAVEYKDLPGMADVDSSLYGFLKQVKNRHTVALSGECADEIFGGYPWFFREEMLYCDTFPWCPDLSVREKLLAPELAGIELSSYVQQKYKSFLSDMPAFSYRNDLDTRRREIGYLNIYWFMATLLTRKDRMSMASGLEVRVPFCDHRLVQYVWNIPWDIKAKDGERKHVLREAARGLLPEKVRCRKKSPYPKTHNPDFERLVKQELQAVLADKNAPVLPLIDINYAKSLCQTDFNYGKPWFGQLMAGPQMIAYLLQVNHWLKTYNVQVTGI